MNRLASWTLYSAMKRLMAASKSTCQFRDLIRFLSTGSYDRLPALARFVRNVL